MMRFLLIHTAGAEGTVALADVSGVVAEGLLPGRSSSERLVPEVRRLLEGAGWPLAELSAVVVVHGPGSFTGVRVGLSAAKGLSEAGGVPLVAVSRLALLAAVSGFGAGRVYPVLDAGRREFYFGVYEGGVCLRESLLTAAEVVEAVGTGRVVACEAKVAEGLVGVEVVMLEEPSAGDLLGIAIERLGRGAVDDAAVVDANYLRRTDFEIQQRLEQRAAGLSA
ncbi:MAG: peptidase glycoprotease [Acidobacteriaceae bacterium]|nr:peptidase glycoprotease [Acidobacteriaceae bacterium]